VNATTSSRRHPDHSGRRHTIVRSSIRANALLLVVCLAQFMVILDVAIVNVALPSIRSDLHFSSTGLQWVVNAYTLTFAGFLMLGGRAADLLGRRRVLLVGTAVFAATSLLCAIASSRGLLIGARAMQGLAGAVVSPATMSIIATSFAEGRERNRALGAWVTMGALGASSGALLGGVLTQTLGWPAIFAINGPLGLLAIMLGLRVIPAGARPEGPRHFDLAGAVLVTAGLVGLTYGIVRSDALGWGASGVLVPLAAGVGLLAAFVVVEGRLSRVPLVPLSIFRLAQLRAANLVVVLMYAAFFAMWFFLTLYLQQVLGDDALQAGLKFLPMTGAVFAGSRLAPRLVGRYGVRAVVVAGILLATAGLVWLTGVAPDSSYLAVVLPGGVLSSVGMGMALVPATIAAVQGVPASQSGVASGLLNTSRLVGGALGLALLSTIATAHTRHELGAAVAAPRALTDGFAVAFEVGAGFCIAGALIAVALLRASPAAHVPSPHPLPARPRRGGEMPGAPLRRRPRAT
jgi:EmrB/QacA subfamily drug resistance transporter